MRARVRLAPTPFENSWVCSCPPVLYRSARTTFLPLTDCLELAVKEAERLKPTLSFRPVSITSYKDGAHMLTATCAVSELSDSDRFPRKEFWNWRFASRGWRDIEWISAPLLSSREQHRLDAHLNLGPKRMLSALSFSPAGDTEKSLEALRSYKTFHRYYPTFRHVEE